MLIKSIFQRSLMHYSIIRLGKKRWTWKKKKEEDLKEAIADLTPRQREVIYLKYFEGLSTDELAEILQIRAQSIYNLVHDALENLRIFLND